MNNKENFSVIKVKENGVLKEYDVLFLFYPKNSNRTYIVYTDNTTDEAGSKRRFAKWFDESKKDNKMYPLETEEEWFTVEAALNKLEEMKGKE